MPGISDSTTLTIVHPFDPLRQGIGGFHACIYAILKQAPEDWQIELIGITTNPQEQPIRKWQSLEFEGRRIRFYPVLSDTEPDRVQKIPLSFRFAAAGLLSGVKATGRIVHFHRFESSYAVRYSNKTQHSVYFLHNDPVEEVSSSHTSIRWKYLPTLFFSLLRKRIADARAVVVVHPRTANWIKTQITGSLPEVFILKEWADPEIFYAGSEIQRKQSRSDLRRRLNLPLETKIVVFAGRLEKQKDPDLLIRSFAILNQIRSDVRLLIVGKGRMENVLRIKIQNLGLQDKVHMEGKMNWSDLAEAYRGCDVAVCTSAFESGPRQVFEALACGIPVVCSDVGQARDLIPRDSRCGTIIRSREAGDFANAISDLVETASQETVHHCQRIVAECSPKKALAPLFATYNEWLTPVPAIRHSETKRKLSV